MHERAAVVRHLVRGKSRLNLRRRCALGQRDSRCRQRVEYARRTGGLDACGGGDVDTLPAEASDDPLFLDADLALARFCLGKTDDAAVSRG